MVTSRTYRSDNLTTLIDEPIWKTGTGGAVYYHANALYCVSALTNGSGAVVERYRYTPYGELTILAADGVTVRSASNYANPWTYTGRRWDSEIGKFYYRRRNLDPTLGRFMSRDPLGYVETAGTCQYCSSRPVGRIDPSGTLSIKNAKDVTRCFLSCAQNPGRPHDGFTKRECADLTLTRLSKAEIVDGLGTIGRDLIIIPITTVIPGKWTKFTIEQVRSLIEDYLAGVIDIETLYEKIFALLEEALADLTPEEMEAIKGPLKEWLNHVLKYSSLGCKTVTLEREPSSKYDGTTITCQFLVCADAQRGIKGEDVEYWTITGACNVTCEKTVWERCCCGTQYSFTVTADGSGVARKKCMHNYQPIPVDRKL